MRIEMNGKMFKSYMDRATAIAKTGSVNMLWECVEIVANQDGVFLKAINGESAVTIQMEATMTESGFAFIHAGDIKRVCNLDGYITIESDKERVSVRNEKKKSDVRAMKFEDERSFYEEAESKGELFRIVASDLLNALGVVDSARVVESDTRRPVLTGYNINGKIGRVIGCDGFRMHTIKLPTIDKNVGAFCDFNRTVCGMAYAQLKKILKGHGDCQIAAYDYGSFLKLTGDDFEYYAKYIEGDYPDVYKSVYLDACSKSQYSYTVDASELCGIAKDYAKQRAMRDEHIMYLACKNGEMISAFASSDYRTADKLSSARNLQNVKSGHMIGMNPDYIAQAMSALSNFSGDAEVFGEYREVDGSNIKGVGIKQGDIDMLILPVRGKIERIQNVRNFVCGM